MLRYSSSKSALVRTKQNLFLFSPICHVFPDTLLWDEFDKEKKKKKELYIFVLLRIHCVNFIHVIRFLRKSGLFFACLDFEFFRLKHFLFALPCFLSADFLQEGFFFFFQRLFHYNMSYVVQRKYPGYVMAFFFFLTILTEMK